MASGQKRPTRITSSLMCAVVISCFAPVSNSFYSKQQLFVFVDARSNDVLFNNWISECEQIFGSNDRRLFCLPLTSLFTNSGRKSVKIKSQFISLFQNDSSIFVDWSRSIQQYPHQIRQYTVHYIPAVGHPPTHSVFPASTQSLAINRTLPAVDYRLNVSALLTDNRRVPILSTIVTSSKKIVPNLQFFVSRSTTANFGVSKSTGRRGYVRVPGSKDSRSKLLH